jgi:aminoglycoside 6'-N-acetyltransferase
VKKSARSCRASKAIILRVQRDSPDVPLKDFILSPVREDAMPLLTRWLSDPRVFEFYMSANDPRSEAAVRDEFFAEDYVERFIVQWSGEWIGYLQFYEVEPESREAYGVDKEEPAYGMDQFIGDPRLWDRGIGSALVRQTAEYLVRERGASRVFLDPHVDNGRAVRAYERAGFRKVRVLLEHEMREGRLRDAWLMQYSR